MDVTRITDEVCKDIILGRINQEFEFLALKILLSRLRLKSQQDPSPSALQQSVAELKGLFVKFGNMPSMQRDFEKIMNGRLS